jgi:glycosyltransferase involved in cell wall biosynthesis
MAGDLLCLSHLRWGFVYQRPNHLMSRWARERRVFFVEEAVHDAPTPRLWVKELEPNLHVVVPQLPAGTPPEETERLTRVLLDGLVTDARVRDPIVWMYTPMALGFSRHLRRSLTVYDCMDELTGFRGAPPILREREQELFRMADLVFTGGHSLYEAKRAHHARVHAFPSSVDAAHFAKARSARRQDEPADQRAIPHPRVGFFGVIDERMDLDLLRATAERRPNQHVVVLGPVVKMDPAHLPQLPNLHFLGQKSYAELPAYLAGWDVAIMPFALNEATRYISPTKTLEYLAAGKPVVSTPIHDVVRPYGERGLVRIASTPDEFAAAIDAALDDRHTPAFASRRASCDEFVAQTSWDRTWAHMHSLVREVLAVRTKADAQEAPCSIISS